MTKIIIRRLPPTITKEELEEQLQPLPEVDYMEFFSNDTSLYPHLFARAYINFKNQEDIVLFRDRFDGYVFIDSKGQEYSAIVEFAPFQKTAKKRTKKKDAKCGTILEDPDYKKFLEIYNGNDEKLTSTPETLLEEIEARSKEFGRKSTPLLDFLKNKQRVREEKREERRRRELERKRLRDEERRKWREEEKKKRKESDKTKRIEKTPEKDKDQAKDEPKIKLLKKPDRSEDGDMEHFKEKMKKPNKEDRPVGHGDHKRRQTHEHKDDRSRKDEGRKEYKDYSDHDRDREKERRLKEKERLRRLEDERRRRRERQEEHTYKKREDEFKREKEHGIEKKKINIIEAPQNEKSTKENNKKEDSVKRERLRNKDRPAIQLYQPGARSRNRSTVTGADQKSDPEATHVSEKGND
uniref:UPF3 domain-containing protein n=1 Tax=Knipowitschia caucasica TaxID=637954 RepID=A0AAV2MK77_KNICA